MFITKFSSLLLSTLLLCWLNGVCEGQSFKTMSKQLAEEFIETESSSTSPSPKPTTEVPLVPQGSLPEKPEPASTEKPKPALPEKPQPEKPYPSHIPPTGSSGYNFSMHDAHALYEAMKGLGTDEKTIINIITNRTNSQRQDIREAYRHLYDQDLLHDLKDDLSGNFENTIIALMRKPYEYLAIELEKTITSIIPQDHAVAQILGTRSKTELIQLYDAYGNYCNSSLKEDIDEWTDGDFKLFLKQIVSHPDKMRPDSGIKYEIIQDGLDFIPHGEDNCGPVQNNNLDETLTKESFETLHRLVNDYQQKYNKTVTSMLKKWCKDLLMMDAYVQIVEYAEDPVKYYAKELYDAMIGLGTNDSTLIRIIVSRSEIDLDKIKKVYEEQYNRTLASSIEHETSGHYKVTLLKLVHH